MKTYAIFLALFLIIMSVQVNGQEFDEYDRGENWLKDYGIYPEDRISFRFDRYSKADLLALRERLAPLYKSSSDDEWSGLFVSDTVQLGVSHLNWNPKIGFVELYVYSCQPELRHLNYGSVTETKDSITLIPQFIQGSPRKAITEKFIKLKWNDRRYLVAEGSLLSFSEKAVGIDVRPGNDEEPEEANEHSGNWYNYWVKGDLDKDLFGLPEFPSAYQAFRRTPISSEILSVAKRVIVAEYQTSRSYYTAPSALYRVVLKGGKSNGIRPGMEFLLSGTGEEIVIERVSSNKSYGVLIRSLDDDGRRDYCLDSESKQIQCPVIGPRLEAKTRVGRLWL